jgi:hypothetical protein
MAEDIIDVTNPPKYVLEAKVDLVTTHISLLCLTLQVMNRCCCLSIVFRTVVKSAANYPFC